MIFYITNENYNDVEVTLTIRSRQIISSTNLFFSFQSSYCSIHTINLRLPYIFSLFIVHYPSKVTNKIYIVIRFYQQISIIFHYVNTFSSFIKTIDINDLQSNSFIDISVDFYSFFLLIVCLCMLILFLYGVQFVI